jgi:hypothetical protein
VVFLLSFHIADSYGLLCVAEGQCSVTALPGKLEIEATGVIQVVRAGPFEPLDNVGDSVLWRDRDNEMNMVKPTVNGVDADI